MTLEVFSESSPGTAEIRFFVGDQAKTVQGITISTSACNGLNTYESLLLIESLTVNIGGEDYTFRILNREVKLGYFFLTVEDTYVNLLSTPVLNSNSPDCNFVNFTPSVYDPEFENSDYNALFANATDIRLNTFAYDVDRQKSQTAPTNLDNIISDNAIYAPVPDSNYTSIGLLNSRYDGAKTSVVDYGVESSINLTLFDGVSYPINTSDNNICSQSLSERTIEVFGFDSSGNPKVSPDTLPTASYTAAFFDGQIIGDSSTPASLSSDEAIFEARMKKTSVPYIKPGIFLQLTETNNTIYVQVVSITYKSNYNFFNDVYDIVVKKHILTQSANLLGNVGSSYHINIRVGFSDVVYFFEGNKIIPYSNKKLYLGLTGQIIRTGPGGRVIDISSTCSL